MAKARTVGIFSRDVENSKWLEQLLKSEPFHKRGIDIRPVYISNDGSQFRGEVSHCTFAILYHTKNRGMVNVTNVTDSLYDTELDHLYNVLGKPNVIVVIDDLEDSSSEKKSDILQNQSSIKEQARELFLFSTEEKDNHTITSMKEKIKTMKEILCEGRAGAGKPDQGPNDMNGREGNSGKAVTSQPKSVQQGVRSTTPPSPDDAACCLCPARCLSEDNEA